jgi:hypothetical protein
MACICLLTSWRSNDARFICILLFELLNPIHHEFFAVLDQCLGLSLFTVVVRRSQVRHADVVFLEVRVF